MGAASARGESQLAKPPTSAALLASEGQALPEDQPVPPTVDIDRSEEPDDMLEVVAQLTTAVRQTAKRCETLAFVLVSKPC
jgi:hypothetical protein